MFLDVLFVGFLVTNGFPRVFGGLSKDFFVICSILVFCGFSKVFYYMFLRACFGEFLSIFIFAPTSRLFFF